MGTITLSQNQIVGDVLEKYPATARVFLNRGMGCVGCAMAPFETLADVARIYGLGPECLLEELQHTVNRRNAP